MQDLPSWLGEQPAPVVHSWGAEGRVPGEFPSLPAEQSGEVDCSLYDDHCMQGDM